MEVIFFLIIFGIFIVEERRKEKENTILIEQAEKKVFMTKTEAKLLEPNMGNRCKELLPPTSLYAAVTHIFWS